MIPLLRKKSAFLELVEMSYLNFKPLFFGVIWVIVGQAIVFLPIVMILGLGVNWVSSIITFFIVAGLMAYFQAAKLLRAYGILHNEQQFVDNTWKMAKDRMLPVIGLFCVLGVAGFALGAIFFASLVLGGHGALSVIMALIGIVIFIYLSIKLYFALPLLVIYEEGILSAIAVSFAATRGQWWRIVGVLFLVVAIPHMGFSGLEMLFSGEHFLLNAITFLISLAAFIVTAVLNLSATLVLLNDLQSHNIDDEADRGSVPTEQPGD